MQHQREIQQEPRNRNATMAVTMEILDLIERKIEIVQFRRKYEDGFVSFFCRRAFVSHYLFHYELGEANAPSAKVHWREIDTIYGKKDLFLADAYKLQ